MDASPCRREDPAPAATVGPMGGAPPGYANLADASRYLYLSPRTLRRWARSGWVPARSSFSGEWVFFLADLQAMAVRFAGPAAAAAGE